MAKLLGRLIALIEWWAVFLLVALTAVVCLGVFFRYVLNDSLVWYDEFASYLLVWLTFYGAVVAHYHQRHINFDLMVEKLAPLPRRVADVVAELAVLGFQFVLFYYGWILTERLDKELLQKMVPPMIVNEPDKNAFIKASGAVYEEFGKQVPGGAELVKLIQSLR